VRVITLPVRFYRDKPEFATLTLEVDKCALMLVDCDGDCGSEPNAVIRQRIAPALYSARELGMKVIYFHNAAGGEGGPRNISRELHGTRHGYERLGPPGWKPYRPDYAPWIAPLGTEPEFQKADRNGFRDTFADQYLKTWGIETVIAVGFSLRSCLYHTCVGAQEHNYRVVTLRDCTDPAGTNEFVDTVDKENPEGGWVRFIFLRMLETNEGYSSTSDEFVRACADGMR
jgi:nicotinamidase-related amidase